MGFDHAFVEEVRRSTDVLQEIGRYVELKKSGSRWRGLCPFHNEKTPSFYVDDTAGLYKCFGCGKGGDLFRFVMEMEHLTFPEAVEMLARRAGLRMPERRERSSGPRFADIEKVLEAAVLFYHRSLFKEGTPVRAYLEKRHLGDDLCKKWSLGWAPGHSALWNYLRPRFDPGLIEAAGVINKGASGTYDTFRERLIFPLHSATGRIVGLSGRNMTGDPPKYVNSKESAFFQKRRILYGFHLARREAGKQGEWLVVEGHTDCIRLHEAGLTNTVATMGTALTAEHGALLNRVAPRVVLCFDGDEAGRSAVEKALPALLSSGLEVNVLFLPAGTDPDEIILREGRERFQEMNEKERLTFFDFLILREYPEGAKRLSPLEKSNAAQKVMQTISLIKDPIRHYEYLQKLSGVTGLPVRLLKKSSRDLPGAIQSEPEKPMPDMESILLAILLREKDLQTDYRDRLHEDLFTRPECRFTVQILLDLLSKGEGVDFSDFSHHLIERGQDVSFVSDLAFLETKSELIETYLLHLEENYYRRRLQAIQEELEQAGKNDLQKLLEEKQQISTLLLSTRQKRADLNR